MSSTEASKEDCDIEVAQPTALTQMSYQPKWVSSKVHLGPVDVNVHEIESISTSNVEKSGLLFLDDCDELPGFADEECREMYRQIKSLEIERGKILKATKDHEERVQVMKEHMETVKQEISHANHALAAKQEEISLENHLIAIQEREKARLNSEIRTIIQSTKAEESRISVLDRDIESTNEEIERLKLSLNWNQEELEQWVKSATKMEKDHLDIQKYTRGDEAKVKALISKLENVTKTAAEVQASIDNEVTESNSKRLELDRLTKLFKTDHEDRKQLLVNWQNTINGIKDRDAEINDLSIKYSDVTNLIDSKIEDTKVMREKLSELQVIATNLKREIDSGERIVIIRKQERNDVEETFRKVCDDIETLKLEKESVNDSLQQVKIKIAVRQEELEKKSRQLEDLKNKYETLTKQLEEEESAIDSKKKLTQTSEERLRRVEHQLKREAEKVELLKKERMKLSEKLASAKLRETNLRSDIKSENATAKVLNSRIIQLQKEMSKQNEVVYTADYKLQQIEYLISRGLGERSDDEKQQLQHRISELEQEYAALDEKTKKMIQRKRHTEKEISSWKRKLDHSTKRIQDYEATISEIKLEISACEACVIKLESKKDEDMVSHDMVRLEVHKLRDILKDKITELHHLQMQRDEVNIEFMHKKRELNIEIEILVAQLRQVEEERHKIAIKLGQRKIAAEKLKSKYEVMRKAHNIDGVGGENPQVIFLIEAAQKKADLQREGDKLDSMIQQKEKEIKDLKVTLSSIQEQNSRFRKSFMKLHPSSLEYKELMKMEQKTKENGNNLVESRKQLYVVQKEYDSICKQLKDIENRHTKILEENRILEETKVSIAAEIEQICADKRAVYKEIQEERIKLKGSFGGCDQDKVIALENEIEAEIIEKYTDKILLMLLEVGKEFPEIKGTIIKCLAEAEIDIPSKINHEVNL